MNWNFGLQELIQSIAALLTLAAIIVSLYLATKSKTLKYRLYKKEVDKEYLKKQGHQKIIVLNTGHIKFTITSIGYIIDKKYYFSNYNRYQKKLNESIIEKNGYGGTTQHSEEISILPTYLFEGDCIEMLLYPKDFDFVDSKKDKKVYYFIMINDKIKKKYTGLHENDFYNICKEIKGKSPYAKSGDKKARDPLDLFFRC